VTSANALHRSREAYESRAWSEAHALLSAADRKAPLCAEDLERLAVAAYLIGRNDDSDEAFVRAYHDHLAAGIRARAARCAFWLGFGLLNRGEMARGGGWLARAGRLLDEHGQDCVEKGYVLMPNGIQAVVSGDAAGALITFRRVAEVAERFGDLDLLTMARLGSGHALLALGQMPGGAALLDEAMIAVTTGEVSPVVAGLVYCGVIDACQSMFDLRRAQEWTAALTQWCTAQPDLVPYRGQCLVHRSQIMTFHGAWADAMDEARRARDRLSEPQEQPAVGVAYYQLGELHRLSGDGPKAEEAYRRANQWGHAPQPGLALLRLGQGHVSSALAAIQRVLDESSQRVRRAKLLPAYVEIALAAGEVAAARAAAEEIAALAAALGAPMLSAQAAQAEGAVLLAENAARGAMAHLRRAWTDWCTLEAPYDAARVRVLLALACRQLGDEDGAALELDAAANVFRKLGAAPDLARVERLWGRAPSPAGGLTEREQQVLRLVASGRKNRAVAEELAISEKTVARHMSNIFTKLGLANRAAATAYAYEHNLV
jgi:DNA-binding CsgD family transcriptional regulator